MFRMIMLLTSVDVYKFDPIFVGLCGLAQAMIAVFKSVRGKKKFIKIKYNKNAQEPWMYEGTPPSLKDTPKIVNEEK